MSSIAKYNNLLLHGWVNWPRWRHQFEAIARYKCLWGIFTGEEKAVKKPDPAKFYMRFDVDIDTLVPDRYKLADKRVDAGVASDLYFFNLKRHEEYCARVHEARALLQNHCSNEAIDGVEDLKEAFDKLEQSFTGTEETVARHTIMNEFNQLRLTEDDQVHDFLRKLDELRKDLAVVGKKTSDDDMIFKITHSLTPAFKPFVDGYYEQLRRGHALSFMQLCLRAVQWGIRLEQENEKSVDSARGRSNINLSGRGVPTNSDRNSGRLKPCCSHCGRSNHLDTTCFYKHPELLQAHLRVASRANDNNKRWRRRY